MNAGLGSRKPVAVLALSVLLLPAIAAAHGRSASSSRWVFAAGGASVEVRLAALDATALGPGIELDEYLTTHLTLTRGAAGETPCTVTEEGVVELPAAPGWLRRRWELRCASDASGAWRIHSDLLVDHLPQHSHLAIAGPSGGELHEALLNERHRDLHGSATPTAPAAGRWVILGVEHILSGWDHLVFLLVLLLAGGSLRRQLVVASGFTAGHGASVALAVFGIVRPEARLVEGVIGVSIAWVAVEDAWLAGERRDRRLPAAVVLGLGALAIIAPAFSTATQGSAAAAVFAGLMLLAASYFAAVERAARPERWRMAIASGFGLVHGLGFAGTLQHLEIPRGHLAGALLGFNIGVEVAQLVILAAGYLLISAARSARTERWRRFAVATALGFGTFWIVERVFG